MRAHVASSILCGLALCLPAAPARAQAAGAQSVAMAKALYDRAVEAMNERDFATACPQLEEAVKLEPEALGARMKLAECYEGWGKLASAWVTYLQVEGVAAKTNQDARRKKAHDAADALKPRLAEVVLGVRDEIRDLDGLEIKLDGVVIGNKVWGVPLPVDPGKHTLDVRAAGKKPVQKTFTVEGDAARTQVNVPLLPDLSREEQKPKVEPVERPVGQRGVPVVRITTDDAEQGSAIALYRVETTITGTATTIGFGTRGTTFTGTSLDAVATRVVCMAPCARAIDAAAGQEFYLGGKDLSASGRFRLDDRGTDVTLHVTPGSNDKRIGGGILIGLGAASIAASPILIGPGAAGHSSGSKTFLTSGIIMLVAGAVLTGIGVPVHLSGRTTYEFR